MSVIETIQARKEEGAKPHGTRIEDLPIAGKEVSEDYLEMVAGGMRRYRGTFTPDSCTMNCDVDGHFD
jgi:hypothetical protein